MGLDESTDILSGVDSSRSLGSKVALLMNVFGILFDEKVLKLVDSRTLYICEHNAPVILLTEAYE